MNNKLRQRKVRINDSETPTVLSYVNISVHASGNPPRHNSQPEPVLVNFQNKNIWCCRVYLGIKE